jgi:hypothetical protein
MNNEAYIVDYTDKEFDGNMERLITKKKFRWV